LVAEPHQGAVRERAYAVEGRDRRQPGDELLARVVVAGRDQLVDVLDGDRQHIDDHLVLTVEHFTVGHALAEQAPRPDADALKDFDMAAFTEEHPTVVAGITEYFQPGRTVDDLFRECLEVIIEGAAAKAGSTP
jgi:hypothetical protein